MQTTETTLVHLHIVNGYEAGEIETSEYAVVPLPVPAEGSDERTDWEYEHIFPLTGTGREGSGDAWYDVEITDSATPELVGMRFEFGY